MPQQINIENINRQKHRENKRSKKYTDISMLTDFLLLQKTFKMSL